MNCPRCNGLMVKEWMISSQSTSQSVMKCVNCGNYDDVVFSANRKIQYVAQRVSVGGGK